PVSLAEAVGPDLRAVAAKLHRAPAATTRLARVDQQKTAVLGGADANAPGEWTGEQIDGVAGKGGERGGRGRRDESGAAAWAQRHHERRGGSRRVHGGDV